MVMTYVVATNCVTRVLGLICCGTSRSTHSLQLVFWHGRTEKLIRCENLLKVMLDNDISISQRQ